MRRPDLDADPPLPPSHSAGGGDTPTACAGARPVRTGRKDVSYAPVNELRTQYQTAAKLHLATGMSIADACTKRGMNRSGSDYSGVRHWVTLFKMDGTAKVIQMPNIAPRVAAAAADVPGPRAVPPTTVKPRTYADIDTDADFESYCKAYRRIGVLMSGRCAQGYAKAKRAVEETMSWTIKRSSAFSSQANKGLKDPEKPGRKLAMGAAAEDVMVRSINMLRSMRLPTRKHIVLRMATNSRRRATRARSAMPSALCLRSTRRSKLLRISKPTQHIHS